MLYFVPQRRQVDFSPKMADDYIRIDSVSNLYRALFADHFMKIPRGGLRYKCGPLLA